MLKHPLEYRIGKFLIQIRRKHAAVIIEETVSIVAFVVPFACFCVQYIRIPNQHAADGVKEAVCEIGLIAHKVNGIFHAVNGHGQRHRPSYTATAVQAGSGLMPVCS